MLEIVNKYKWKIVAVLIILLIILFSAKSCNSKQADELAGENKILKQQTEILKDGLNTAEKNRLKQKDSIRLENIKREEEQKKLEKKALDSENLVKKLEAENIKTKKEIKNLSLVGVADEINKNYNTKDATATSNSIDIKNSTPYLILETIADANTAQDIIKEKDIQISSKDSLNSSLKEDKKALTLNLFSAEKNLNSSRELNQLQTNLNNKLEKENKKLKTKNTFTKILIPVVGAIGVFIGTQTGK